MKADKSKFHSSHLKQTYIHLIHIIQLLLIICYTKKKNITWTTSYQLTRNHSHNLFICKTENQTVHITNESITICRIHHRVEIGNRYHRIRVYLTSYHFRWCVLNNCHWCKYRFVIVCVLWCGLERMEKHLLAEFHNDAASELISGRKQYVTSLNRVYDL